MKRILVIGLVLALVGTAGAETYLYKKVDNAGKAIGLISGNTEQPAKDKLVKIDKAEFDTIKAQMKADEEAKVKAKPSLKKQVKELKEMVKDLEKRIKALEGG